MYLLKSNKKVFNILICTSLLFSLNAAMIAGRPAINQTVKAAKRKRRKAITTHAYGVDVAAYQSGSVKGMANAGAKFAIVKVSEGTGYRNPKASAQISSAISSGMMPMAYHFALFGANKAAAKREANYAANTAKSFGLPLGSYIACDWESGDSNNVHGGKASSARAIIVFMKEVQTKGYKPLLYSGASLLRNNISTAKVTRSFPNSLWVASYATMGRIDNPNFSYFPSMNGVAIWQFTDNWRGLNVDGNISLLPLSISGVASQAPKANTITTKKTIMHKTVAYNRKGKKKQACFAGQKITVYGGMVKIKGQDAYRIGKDTYVSVSAVDGLKRIALKKTNVYTAEGKLASGVPTIAKGATVVTGNQKIIDGVRYYQIHQDEYVRASDLS